MLTFDDKGSLQKDIMILNEIFTEYRLQINITKTITMIFNQQYTGEAYLDLISSINGKRIENVKTYKYLGSEIKFNETTGSAELNLRSDAATSKFYSLSKNLMNPKIYLKSRILMLNSLVQSQRAYSCQTWSCN